MRAVRKSGKGGMSLKQVSAADVIHVWDKNTPPVLHVSDGETVVFETAKPGIPDETFTRDYTVEPYPKRVLSITGPVYVDGAEPGDVLKLEIRSIELDDWGKMWMGQWMGILMDEVDHCYMKKVAVDEKGVRFNEKLRLPLKPMIGTIGVAPAGEPVNCVLPGDFGGNMDNLDICAGNTLYLPVSVPGALLALGDVHAAMGYGEVLGTGVEIGSKVTLRVEVLKDRKLDWPLVETKDSYEVIASGTDMAENCREATRRAIRFVQQRTGLGFDEAYALVGQTSDLKILQVVNYSSSIVMEIPKAVLQ